MPIDPSILLQGQNVTVPNPLTGLKDVASIANLMGEVQNRNLLGQVTQQKLAADQAVQQALPDIVKSGWHPDTINAAMQAAPMAAPGILSEWGNQVKRLGDLASNADKNMKMLAGEAQWLSNKPDITWEEISPAVKKATQLGLNNYLPPPQPTDTPQAYAKRYAGALMSPENQVAYMNSISEDANRTAERFNQAVKTQIEARTANQANVGLSPDNILYQKLPGGVSGTPLPQQSGNMPNPLYATQVQQAPVRGNWDVTNPQKTIAQINSIPNPQDRQAAMEQFKAALGPAGKEAIAYGSGSGGGSGPVSQGSGFQPQQIGPSVIQKASLAKAMDTVADLDSKRMSAISAMPLLKSMEANDNGGMLSGQVAGSAWGQALANVIAGTPFVTDDYRAKVANAQVFQKDASNLIAQGLKAIGGGRVLASEISLLQSGNPSALQQPEARQAIYQLIRNQLQANIDNAVTAHQHLNAGNYDLSGWTPKEQPATFTPAEIMKQKNRPALADIFK